MTIQEIASGFVALCAQGKLAEAQQYWSDELVSIEGFPSQYQITKGRAAVIEKHAFWNANNTSHGVKCEGPFILGDQFAAIFELDSTGFDGKRASMREVALYTVKDGAIVEERFFPLMA